jgi:hypothetical protein
MPFSTIPENIIRKYIAVKALVERGATDGEKNAARKALQGLEEKHPTIRLEAELFEQFESGNGPKAEPPPRAPNVDPNFGPYTASNGNWGGAEKKPQSPPPTAGSTPPQPERPKWGNWQDILGEAWNFAKDVTESAVNAEAGRVWADQSFGVEFAQTAAGNARFTAVSPIQALMKAKYGFNDVQKQAFAKRVGEKVAEKVYAFLVAG